MLCNEPLSNLDADLRERMRIEIASRVRLAGATTVYITHDQAEAFPLADVAFRGRGYEHAVELDSGTQISGVFSETRVGRGETVGLRLETAGCLVFPAITEDPPITK